jgi:hypothetical protein
VIAAIVVLAAPAAIAAKISSESKSNLSNHEDDLVSIEGKVTKLLYNDWNDTDDDEDDMDDDDMNDDDMDDDDMNEAPKKNKTHEPRLCAFVLDNETVVTFGPWWYWTVQNVTVADVVRLNDTVNVTGEIEEEDGMTVLSAWHIKNVTTGDELTIREEGRPPWAGGPKALGIDPWPMSNDM